MAGLNGEQRNWWALIILNIVLFKTIRKMHILGYKICRTKLNKKLNLE
jgi:hypothetical protein